LRIEVNQEMEGLKEMLKQCIDCIKPGGRMVIISYHSIEDRLVKNFMNSGNVDGQVIKDFYGNKIAPFTAVNKKLILPSEEEIAKNPRARSAKLRIAERIIDA
jgi:16S rRNA (cytosine1402-N4)-methyltransferase